MREYSRRERLSLYLCLGLVALATAPRLAAAGTVAWGWLVGGAVATAAASGPGAWIARERLPEDRITTIKLLLGAAALLALPFVLTAVLLRSLPIHLVAVDSAILGAIAGVAVVYLAERRGIPDRFVGQSA